jgi:hypothetical protein
MTPEAGAHDATVGMSASLQPPAREFFPRCAACQDVIGVYEPAVVILDGVARHTSRAADRSLRGADEPCYHLACYPSPGGGPGPGPA